MNDSLFLEELVICKSFEYDLIILIAKILYNIVSW